MGSRALVGIAAGAVLGTVALLCALVPTACVGHQCDYSESNFGLLPGEGEVIPRETNVWESNPINSPWVPYPHAHRTKLFVPFDISPDAGTEIVDVTIYISPDQNPGNTPFTNWTTAAGNLAQIRNFGSQIWVDNGTCADFFMRAVVTVTPLIPVVDAGPDAPEDAPTDADEGGN